MIASPEEHPNIPVSIFIKVVLPAPLWPRMENTSPSFIENFILSTAVKSPNFFVKFLIRIASDLSKNFLSKVSNKASLSSARF